MRKLVIALAAIAFLGVAVSQPVQAGTEKVPVCHVSGQANDGVLGFVSWGHQIEVSEAAVEAHLSHGDSTSFMTGGLLYWIFEKIAVVFGSLPNGDCVFFD